MGGCPPAWGAPAPHAPGGPHPPGPRAPDASFAREGRGLGKSCLSSSYFGMFLFAAAHAAGKLQAELARLGRCPLLVMDGVGCIPFEPEAANL